MISGGPTRQRSRSIKSDRRKTSRLSGTSQISLFTKLYHFWVFRIRKHKPFSDEEIEQQLSLLDYYETTGESNGGWDDSKMIFFNMNNSRERELYYNHVYEQNKVRDQA